ncbi:MAG: glycoside hydrolase family 88 protein [Candidatus Hydrogenedentes bacterium]|nr:glycoside hydrolase family 88 protein [Candidatus Hydrogenedentota bacterium]
MHLPDTLNASSLSTQLDQFFSLAGPKLLNLDNAWDPAKGSPVFTVAGNYTSRGWTEWTQGFQYGCLVLQFDASDDSEYLDRGVRRIHDYMAPHISHVGVHDHGFNNLSTYGNVLRLAKEGRIPMADDARAFYELAVKVSGAVQAARWSRIADGTGYIHSFNGPHSLFSDTIRSCRILMRAHQLGHVLMGEGDKKISLCQRALEHMRNTHRFNVYYGTGRDHYDVYGRVVHESIFNMTDGQYRCPSTQQGYTPFSTWTRGLAWVLLGAAEELEFLPLLDDNDLACQGGRANVEEMLLAMARATSDFYIENTTADGIPFWDTGAPGVVHFPNYRDEPGDPYNAHEPLDSSAAAISAQGLLRLGRYLGLDTQEGARYFRAGLQVAKTLLAAPYLSEDPAHQGLLLHSVYHRPNGWDHVPEGRSIPCGESSMWGDYHAMELAVYLKRFIAEGPYLTFFEPTQSI